MKQMPKTTRAQAYAAIAEAVDDLLATTRDEPWNREALTIYRNERHRACMMAKGAQAADNP